MGKSFLQRTSRERLFLPHHMSHRFSQPEQRPESSRQNSRGMRRTALLLKPSWGKGIGVVIVLAFGSGAVLLANDFPWPTGTPFGHALISAVPLLSIGLAALGFQIVIRPNPLDLFKACIVSVAFLLWGIDQLLPSGWLATTLGDVVIVLYVIDLGWMMADRLVQRARSRRNAQETAVSSALLPNLSDLPTQPLHILPMSPISGRAPQTPWPRETPARLSPVPMPTMLPPSPHAFFDLSEVPTPPSTPSMPSPSVRAPQTLRPLKRPGRLAPLLGPTTPHSSPPSSHLSESPAPAFQILFLPQKPQES